MNAAIQSRAPLGRNLFVRRFGFLLLFIGLRIAVPAWNFGAVPLSTNRPPPIEVLSIAELAKLSEDQLRFGNYTAKVAGIVTYMLPQGGRFYLQEGDDAIYVDTSVPIPRAYIGQRVEVTGTARLGWLVPRIEFERAALLGPSGFPEPKQTAVTLLNSGTDAMKFVRVRGTVRDMMLEGTNLVLLVVEQGVNFRVHSGLAPDASMPREWLDAQIEAEGMCRPVSDNFGNAFGFLIYQNNTNLIKVLSGGNSNLFERPLLSVIRAARAPRGPQRVRISGKVTAHTPSHLLYVEDKTGVMRIELLALLPRVVTDSEYLEHEPQTLLRPGERVEVIGAPGEGFYLTPTLQDGEFRRLAGGRAFNPQPATAGQLAAGDYHGQVITMKAKLVDRRAWSEARSYYQMLVLEEGGHVFQARWQGEAPRRWHLPPSGYVQVTGVSEVEVGQMKKLRSFHLLMRDPSDVAWTTPPPIWMREEIRKPFRWVVFVGGIFTLFILAQRRQVQRLQASEGRFRSLIENSFDVTVVLRADGSVKYMSPAGVNLIGKGRAQKNSTGMMVWDVIHPDDVPLIRRRHQEILENPGTTRSVSGYRIISDQGQIRYAEAVGTNCLDVPGVEGVVVNVRDITERKLALDRLERTVLVQTRLNEFATSLSPMHSQEDILWEITRQCISVLGFVDCVIYLLDEERGVLVQRAAYGPKNPRDREILAPLEVAIGAGIVGSVALTGLAEVIPDTRKEPRYIMDDAERLSEISVPILAGGRVLGVIDSEHPEAGFFTQEHLTVLTSIASLCANKLVRANAEEQLKALNADLEKRIAKRTAELQAINDQLRQSEEKFGKAFRASPVILCIARLKDGRFLDVNQAFLAALGLQREQVIGHTAVEIGIWRDGLARDEFLRELTKEGNIRSRAFVIYKDGKPRTLDLSAELIVIGDEPCIVSVSADVTERHEAESELLRALARERELSQLKSRFVATISHEFRTPLGVVLSSADILQRYTDRLTIEQRHEHLRDIQQSAMEMAGQMENILVFGRSEANRLEFAPAATDLPSICRKAIEQISTATENRCEIRLVCPESFPIIKADEALLSHILLNLLSNAVKYSQPKSIVDCDISVRDGMVSMRVSDEGVGIPKRDHESLFLPFHRGTNVGRVRGTGMGLAIVKRCIELHGGVIAIESEEGKGTKVSVGWPHVPILVGPDTRELLRRAP
jgi:PAS domain S-box-containing protein